MKNLFQKILFSLILLMPLNMMAQGNLKFGHFNSQELLASLPERIEAQKKMEEHAKKLDGQMRSMQEELNRKYEEYLSQRDSLTDLVKATKEKDLQELNQRIQTFNQVAQKDLAQKEQELIRPLIEKVQKAIKEVGAENGFTYIFDLSTRAVVYQSEQSIDVSSLLKKKLGVTK